MKDNMTTVNTIRLYENKRFENVLMQFFRDQVFELSSKNSPSAPSRLFESRTPPPIAHLHYRRTSLFPAQKTFRLCSFTRTCELPPCCAPFPTAPFIPSSTTAINCANCYWRPVEADRKYYGAGVSFEHVSVARTLVRARIDLGSRICPPNWPPAHSGGPDLIFDILAS